MDEVIMAPTARMRAYTRQTIEYELNRRIHREVYGREIQGAVPNYLADDAEILKLFFLGLERFGVASIDGDMEDYGRERGRVVTVTMGLAVRGVASGDMGTAVASCYFTTLDLEAKVVGRATASEVSR